MKSVFAKSLTELSSTFQPHSLDISLQIQTFLESETHALGFSNNLCPEWMQKRLQWWATLFHSHHSVWENKNNFPEWMQAPMCARWLCCQKSLRATTLIAFFPLSNPQVPHFCKTISVSSWESSQTDNLFNSSWESSSTELMTATFTFFSLFSSTFHSRATYKTISLSVAFWESRSTEFNSCQQHCSNLCWVICIESSLFNFMLIRAIW